ncbi:MAG: FKBP-type peptidyl-prolyl cis-trans isomerase [Lachnospiraceae bacterium]|nr:FKBP-type peptidyl-prolyl cis-trans isomerase [Lachnospiraceae bacterium]
MNKKKVAIVLAAVLCLCGCGSSGKSGSGSDKGKTDSAPVTQDTVDKLGLDSFIKLAEYKGLSLTKESTEVTDDDLFDAVDEDLNHYRIDVPDMEIADLFWVTMDFDGKIDGQPFVGGSDSNYELKLGQGTFPTEFEEQLLGHKKGDSFKVTITFPKDHENKDIAGKQAEYDVDITRVSVALGEPTEDWTRQYFNETVDEYMADKQKDVAEKNEKNADDKLRTDGWYDVFGDSDVIQYPEDMLEIWTKYSVDTYGRYAKNYNLSYEDFLTEYGVSEESIENNAKEFTKTYLVASAIMKAEGIEPDSDKYNGKKNELLAGSGYASEEAAVAAGISKENIDMTVRYYLATDVILENANITFASGQGAESGEETVAEEAAAEAEEAATEEEVQTEEVSEEAED